jgi:cytochrome c-type biogenesis protein CcmH/NrfG
LGILAITSGVLPKGKQKMPAKHKELKGYIKTENVILLVLLGVAVGFVGGVAFSVYRSSGQMPATADSQNAAMPLPPEKRAAIADLSKQTQNDPKNVSAWTELGHLYFDTGQPRLAIEAYEKSLALDPDRPDVWTDLGVMYRRVGEPAKAVEMFDRALSLNPSHEIAMFNKGVVLMHDLQDSKGAMESWQKLVMTNPEAKTPDGQSLKDLLEQMKKNNPS